MSSIRHLWRRQDPDPSEPSELSERGPLRVAAITFCRDEARMLPLWIRHYGTQLGVENLYVVDDNSSDGSTDDLPCNVLRIPPVRGGKFESTRMGFLSGMARALSELYDCVVFSDVDELIVPDPARYAGLPDFLGRHGQGDGAVGVLGLNVVHAVEAEAPLDLTQPVLGQRQLAKLLPVMCKPSVNFAAAAWCAASHGIRTRYRVDPDLWMFHLKFADRDLLRAAADTRQAVVLEDGRSRNTSWRRGGDELVQLLEEITAGVTRPAELPELVAPTGRELEGLVIEQPPGSWRARKGGQVELMRNRPLVRIPERFHGLV